MTTAGLHTSDHEPFGLLDPAFRVVTHSRDDLRMSHDSQNFDRPGIILFRNVRDFPEFRARSHAVRNSRETFRARPQRRAFAALP